jgi:multidrug resistance protein
VESFVDNDTASAARIFGLFGTAWALMQFLFSPVLGGLSDRFGRRPVVLLSNFGLALDYVLMALAPSLTWLFVGRVISGITSASVSTAFAYIADLTPPEHRAATFGKIGVAFGAGFILGPAVGGLLGGMDPRLPFWVAAGLSFANTLYGLLILPESLPKDRRSLFHWKSANPLGALRLLGSDRVLAGLSVVNFLAQVAHVVLPSTFVLYATYRYGWDATTVGLTLALVGVCSMAVQGLAIGPIVRRLGERRALLLGLGSGAAGFLIRGADRPAVLDRHSRDVAVGRGRRGDPGADDATGRPGPAGPVAGRDVERAERVADGWTLPVHADIRLFHRAPGAAETAGRAVPAGLGVVAAGVGNRGPHAGENAEPLGSGRRVCPITAPATDGSSSQAARRRSGCSPSRSPSRSCRHPVSSAPQ